MALDEYLFGKVAKYYKEKKRAAIEAQNRLVRLESLRSRLTVIACAVSGEAIEIFPAEQEGGYKNNIFFLPATCALFPDEADNRRFYLFRILYLSVQKRLNFNWLNPADDRTLELSRLKSRETAPKVLNVLFDEYPDTQAWFEFFFNHLHALSTPKKEPEFYHLYGKWMANEAATNAEPMIATPGDHGKSHPMNPPKTVMKAKIVEEIRQLTVDKKAQEDYVLTHNFEKVETADEFSGVWRDFDGEDDLEAHHDALDELNMKYTVRVDEPTHSIYQAEFIENASISESADTDEVGEPLLYDEWDYTRNSYKKNFCRLYPIKVFNSDEKYYANTVAQYGSLLRELRKMLAALNSKLQRQSRQIQGDAFDIDSVTDLFADIKAGRTPSEKIYLSSRKKEKDISILLLLDISLSSDSYAAGNRIIDVEKQVSILFGDILDEFCIDFSIHGFYSKTRNHAAFITVKDFDENWISTRNRIGPVDPGGYTRIGVALRHARHLLRQRPAKNKWLILLSDGKPNDFDRYEGRYGIHDVKQALRELHEDQINTYALAIEATAKLYLPQMFGQNNYQILSSPFELLTSLVRLYEKMKSN